MIIDLTGAQVPLNFGGWELTTAKQYSIKPLSFPYTEAEWRLEANSIVAFAKTDYGTNLLNKKIAVRARFDSPKHWTDLYSIPIEYTAYTVLLKEQIQANGNKHYLDSIGAVLIRISTSSAQQISVEYLLEDSSYASVVLPAPSNAIALPGEILIGTSPLGTSISSPIPFSFALQAYYGTNINNANWQTMRLNSDMTSSETPFIVPCSCSIIGASAYRASASGLSFRILNNSVPVTPTLELPATSKAVVAPMGISFVAGDKLSFQVQKTSGPATVDIGLSLFFVAKPPILANVYN